MKKCFVNRSKKRSVKNMNDNIKLNWLELKSEFFKLLELLKSKEFRRKKLKLLGEILTNLLHEVSVNPLLRQYYAYQSFGFIFSYVLFVSLSVFSLIPHYGFTIRVFFPHYLTIHWLIVSIGLGFILYKVNHYYHYQVVMREKIVANGEKGSADWSNDVIQELSQNENDEQLLKEQGLVTVAIHFRTLEELNEEKDYLKKQIEKLKKQLEHEKQIEDGESHESSE